MLAIVAAFLCATAIAAIDYCNQQEYFFVADSIVYPAGNSLSEAREMANRYHKRTDFDGEEVTYNTVTFIGKKRVCEDLQVW